jgi:hypothetical protein
VLCNLSFLNDDERANWRRSILWANDSPCPHSEDFRHRLPHKGTKIIVTEEKNLEKL